MSRFSIENLSDSTEKFRRESFCAVFRNIPPPKKFNVKREGGELQDYLSKIFCLPVLKVLVKQSLSNSLSSSIEKS